MKKEKRELEKQLEALHTNEQVLKQEINDLRAKTVKDSRKITISNKENAFVQKHLEE